MKRARVLAAVGGTALLGSLAFTAPAAADDDELRAHLDPMNNSGVTGTADVELEGRELDVEFRVTGLLAGVPHAVHIHHGAQASHECPTVAQDANRDHRLNVVEGIPKYGPVAVSLTLRGDTSPASGLALDRFSTAPNGMIDYDRDIPVASELARAIGRGEGVMVVHGLDYNANGRYDLEGAGESELIAGVPAETTDPAACGVLTARH